MNEHQPNPQEPETAPETEQRHKTLAVRLDEQAHAQLRFIAQISGNSIADEIRRSIETRIVAAQDHPELVARADQVRQEIEREAAARAAAIAGFLGTTGVTATANNSTRARRTNKSIKPTKE